MDLSKIGQIEYVDFSLVDITILLDTQVDATQPRASIYLILFPIDFTPILLLLVWTVNWSPERKRLNRSIYFSLEIRMTKNVPDINYSEFIGNSSGFLEVIVLFNLICISFRYSHRFHNGPNAGTSRFDLYSDVTKRSDEEKLCSHTTQDLRPDCSQSKVNDIILIR